MAYVIQPTLQSNPDTKLGVALTFGTPGVFTSLLETTAQASNNLKNLLLTRIGERYHQPTFGTTLMNIVFQPSDDEIKQDIYDAITTPVSFWLPYINIDSIDVVTPLDDPSVDYHLMITITYSVSGIVVDPLKILVEENGSVEIE
jgi:phage baseplate assembly protein W